MKNDQTFSVKDFMEFLRIRQQKPERSTLSVRGRYRQRGVVRAVVRLYHDMKDAQIISLVNGIAERAVNARKNGEAPSADKFAVSLADAVLLPVLRKRGVTIPNGYRFANNVWDWSNVRNLLAIKGYTQLKIFDSRKRLAERVKEMAKKEAKGIIRDVEKELKLRRVA